MPNGKLMSDKDHIAANGYVERKINSIKIDYSDINPSGGNKTIIINGDPGFVFSIEVYEGNRVSYYNFKTKLWSATAYKHTKVQSINSSISLNVQFPSQTSLKTFTINIHAETVENIRTTHAAIVESRYEDESLNLNATTGSNSNIVTKVLYQDVIKTLYLSTAAPSQMNAGFGTTNGAVNSNRMILDEDATNPQIVQVGDLIICTGIASSLGVLVTKINPDGDNVHEIEMSAADVVSDGVTVSFFSAFRGMVPNQVSGTTGRAVVEVVSGSQGSFPFSITLTAINSRGFLFSRLPSTEDLCFFNPVTFGAAALPITSEDTTASTYYRWPITNIANLANGMVLDPSRSDGSGTTTSYIPPTTTISNYVVNKTLQRIDESNRYYTDFVNYTERDVFVNGVDPAGNPITAIDRNGRVTARAGNVTFSRQQADALKSDEDIPVVVQGSKAIQVATGLGIRVSDLTITPAKVSTTTSAASSASTTIAMTEVGNISIGQSVRGVGISSTVANPTVVSKSAATGAANIVVSSAQTLEDGTTLFFEGPSNELLIQGTVHVKNMPITDTAVFFNVEGFLLAG